MAGMAVELDACHGKKRPRPTPIAASGASSPRSASPREEARADSLPVAALLAQAFGSPKSPKAKRGSGKDDAARILRQADVFLQASGVKARRSPSHSAGFRAGGGGLLGMLPASPAGAKKRAFSVTKLAPVVSEKLQKQLGQVLGFSTVMGNVQVAEGMIGHSEDDSANTDWKKVRDFLFMDGLNPNYTDKSTLVTTAHRCAYEGQCDILRWCLATGADKNARTEIGRSVLHSACEGNRPGCVRLLLEQGADADIRTLSGLTPLHVACLYNSYEVVLELLLTTGQAVDVDAEDSRRRTPEMLTKDKRILGAIRRYRLSQDDQRKGDLIESALRRLFRLFDQHDRRYVSSAASAESQALLLQAVTPACSDPRIADVVAPGLGQDAGGRVHWDEFRTVHLALIEKLGLEFQDLMRQLHNVESKIFHEFVRSAKADGAEGALPLVTPRARELAVRRLSRPRKDRTLGSLPAIACPTALRGGG